MEVRRPGWWAVLGLADGSAGVDREAASGVLLMLARRWPRRHWSGYSSIALKRKVVGVRGFEPPASASRIMSADYISQSFSGSWRVSSGSTTLRPTLEPSCCALTELPVRLRFGNSRPETDFRIAVEKAEPCFATSGKSKFGGKSVTQSNQGSPADPLAGLPGQLCAYRESHSGEAVHWFPNAAKVPQAWLQMDASSV